MLGGFTCSRNSLIVLNIFYIIVGLILIGLGAHWVTSNKVSSLPIIGGVVACGVFLSIIAVVGLIGTAKHHQVLLFFYMVILLIVFLIQFSIACACLTVSTPTQGGLAQQGWASASISIKDDVQHTFECCGYDERGLNETLPMGHPSCAKIDKCMQGCDKNATETCCISDEAACGCQKCSEVLTEITAQAFSVTGGVSLFFSFTEFFGVWLTYRYRNQKNPLGGNPSAFL